ncbi:MAG TPA: slipin family protein [Bacillota bacterium]|nr:slipin family protein [Bacillota bacterium]HOL10977.1 slipin family protein [Bacillota bacterium]HPO98046.1 slipin family protein [Bacillota bacterium]
MTLMITIRNDERGILFKDGNYLRHLKPGKYFFWQPFFNYKVVVVNVNKPFFIEGKDFNLFQHDQNLLEELVVIDVKDYELVLHFEDGKFSDVYQAGKYAFWNVLKKHEFVVVDTRQPIVDPQLYPILSNPKLEGCFKYLEIGAYEKGLLYFNNQFQKVLEPGIYYYWNGMVNITVAKIDMRQQQIDMTGQEIMTEDKITLRINFVCQYKIVDPVKYVEIKSHEEQMYILLQLILREYVGTLKLDDLLAKKREIGEFVLARLQERNAEFGVVFLSAGVKDIILPGEIREILNTVLIAEKKAQANVITRREETASTRSLLNTAKLMDENQTLYRLKELEFLEKICDKIGHISLTGGGGLLEQLNALLAERKERK